MPPPPIAIEHARRPSRPRRRYLLMLIPLGLLAFFGLRSSPFMQELPWLPHTIATWADSNWVFRSFVGFFVLGLIWFPLISRRPSHALGLAAFGTAVELAQRFIPTRVFDWRDIVASVVGVVAAWVLVIALYALRRRTVGRA